MLLAIGFMSVSFIAGLAALLINADYQTRVASVERENSNLAKSFEGHLLRTISSADRILKLAKTEFESEQRITPAIRTMLTTDASDPAIIQNVIVDSQGNFLAAKTPPPAAMNLAQRTYFQAHIDSPEAGLIISNPIMSEATGKWSIVLSRRLNKPMEVSAGLWQRPCPQNTSSGFTGK